MLGQIELLAKLQQVQRTEHAKRSHLHRIGQWNDNDNVCSLFPVRVAPREVTPGALKDSYDVPVVTFKQHPEIGIILTMMFVIGIIAYRLTRTEFLHSPIIWVGAPILLFRTSQWVLSWLDRPVEGTSRQRALLDRLNVTVTIPAFNEDEHMLDRCIWSLMNQTRLPQRIDVIDDCSNKVDYDWLELYWKGKHANGVLINWSRQPVNGGKRKCHAVTFADAPEADIIITVDSDSTLNYNAIERGMLPFSDPEVQSVAGTECGYNANENLLTLLQNALQIYSQVVPGAVWSLFGAMYTNRGPFALYRASMVREIIDLYSYELFFGHEIRLGDDSLLALCAAGRGKSVQQIDAIALAMWPEKMSHHLRQRTRWARGRTVRNCWRVKYLPMTSYTWWFTVLGIFGYLGSLATAGLLIDLWPVTEHVAESILITMILIGYASACRMMCFHRTDEKWTDKLMLFLIRPVAAMWGSIVLARIVRTIGTCTCLKQHWTTRQQGVELVFSTEGT